MEFVEKVMLIIQLSHVLQGDVVQVFFVFLLNTDGLVAEFSVLEHLCRTYLILNFILRIPLTSVGSEKLTEV